MWSPHLKQDTKTIERVQKFFTKNLRGLKNIPYSQHLLVLNQPNLQIRRDINDLLFLYKILLGDIESKLNSLFTKSS